VSGASATTEAAANKAIIILRNITRPSSSRIQKLNAFGVRSFADPASTLGRDAGGCLSNLLTSARPTEARWRR
jgi:hypothetical protein